jgi:glycosyltransferase involved in cell wall biosynthesis
LRVLLVNDYGTPSGGAEILTLALRDALARRGHDVRLLTSRARPLPLPVEGDYVCFGTTSRLRGAVQTLNPFAARALRRALAGFDPDVVHVRMFLTQLSPLVLRELHGRPSLLHVETVRPICPSGSKLLPSGATCSARSGWVCRGCLPAQDWPLLMLQMALWRRWRPVFDRIVANSHWTGRRLEEDGLPVDEVVWNGVPVVPPRAALAPVPTLAFAGRLAPEKGLDVLLRAFARVRERLPAARLVIAGDGPGRDALAQRLSALGQEGHVERLGHRPRAELDARLGSAWVQAVPSIWEEPFGLVAPEAMMRGVAVVASDAGGLAEIVEDGRTGRLVRRGDADALAAALLGILSDRELAERMGRAGRERALAHFDEERYVDRFVEIYEELLARQKPRRAKAS